MSATITQLLSYASNHKKKKHLTPLLLLFHGTIACHSAECENNILNFISIVFLPFPLQIFEMCKKSKNIRNKIWKRFTRFTVFTRNIYLYRYRFIIPALRAVARDGSMEHEELLVFDFHSPHISKMCILKS
jgi:hypothetical protein